MEFEINYNDCVDLENRQDPFFYKGIVAEIGSEETNLVATIRVCGEVEIVNAKGENYRGIASNGYGNFWNGAVEEEFKNDDALKNNVGSEGFDDYKYWWIHHNWFEISILKPNKSPATLANYDVVLDFHDGYGSINSAVEAAKELLKETHHERVCA